MLNWTYGEVYTFVCYTRARVMVFNELHFSYVVKSVLFVDVTGVHADYHRPAASP